MSNRQIALDVLRLDGGTQTRDEDSSVVAQYAQHLKDLPPADVFEDEAGELWLADGFHRYSAFKLQHKAKMPCVVRKGSLRDALLFAAGANARHGLPRSAKAKRAQVTLLLNDSDWRKRSDRWIATQCVVSHDFVGTVRLELYPPANGSGPDAASSREGKDGVSRSLPEARRKPRSRGAKMGFEPSGLSGTGTTDEDGFGTPPDNDLTQCQLCGEMVGSGHACSQPKELSNETEPPADTHPAVVVGRPLRRPSPPPGTTKSVLPEEPLVWSYQSKTGLVQLELITTNLVLGHQGKWMSFDLQQIDDDAFWRLAHGIQETRA